MRTPVGRCESGPPRRGGGRRAPLSRRRSAAASSRAVQATGSEGGAMAGSSAASPGAVKRRVRSSTRRPRRRSTGQAPSHAAARARRVAPESGYPISCIRLYPARLTLCCSRSPRAARLARWVRQRRRSCGACVAQILRAPEPGSADPKARAHDGTRSSGAAASPRSQAREAAPRACERDRGPPRRRLAAPGAPLHSAAALAAVTQREAARQKVDDRVASELLHDRRRVTDVTATPHVIQSDLTQRTQLKPPTQLT